MIHLERFKNDDFSFFPGFGMDVEMANDYVDFPIDGLDISNYVDSPDSSETIASTSFKESSIILVVYKW
jgi:hypothetical protein